MAPLNFLIVLAFAIVLYNLFNIIYNLFISPLKSIPGPKLWACSSIPLSIAQLRGDTTMKFYDLHQKYGTKVRVGPNAVSFTSPGEIRDVLAHRQGHEEFPKQLKVPAVNGVLGILTAHRSDHSRFRRLLSNSFSDRSIRSQEPVLQQFTNLLIKSLSENASKGPQDMVQWFNWTAFDLTGRLAFGEAFGCLESNETHPWVTAIFANSKALQAMQVLQNYGFDKYVLPLLVTEKARKARQENWQYCSDKIDARMEKGTQNGDFWDHVIEKSDDASGKGMDVAEMKANAGNIILAGSETTATLLAGCIYLLTQNPEVMAKITAEIRSSFKSLDEINLNAVENLPYTLAVLNETLRIYPPVSTQLTRVAPIGGDTVDGKYIPEGTAVYVCQYAANRLESSFTHALEFRPERFLGQEEFKKDNLSALQPFSMGPRNCIGKNLAYAEMRLVLVKFLWSFDLELDPKSKNWVEEQKTFVLWEKGPLLVNLHPVA